MRLARWDNIRGVSAGTWRVVEVPGLILLHQYFYDYWSFALSVKSLDPRGNPRRYYGTPHEMIGPDFTSQFPEAYRVMKELAGRRYRRRSDALEALELVLSGDAPCSLRELL